MVYAEIVERAIEEHRDSPVDILGIGGAGGEYAYVSSHRDAYLQTVREVDELFCAQRSGRSIVEIGPFLGVVCVALKQLGYAVHALDIPEYHESPSLQAFYARHQIPFAGQNLRSAPLPYATGSQDAVIICEVLEHFNFNPLPAMLEINRVLKVGGYLYISMPNQASIQNRWRLLRGRSVHNPVADWFRQLDKNDNMLVGLHWREYTLAETEELLTRLGFAVARKYYFHHRIKNQGGRLKTWLRRLAYAYPPFRPTQVVIGRKTAAPAFDFWRTAANA